MGNPLYSLLLTLATLLVGYELLRHSAPRVGFCDGCGDMVQAPPYLPILCPSCRRPMIIA
jgi:hypothetical protein